jgi:beta-lactamase regulating signal transducer with metallopeptidase domain/uncharacterized GH25 family protein
LAAACLLASRPSPRPATKRAVCLAALVVALLAPACALVGRALVPGALPAPSATSAPAAATTTSAAPSPVAVEEAPPPASSSSVQTSGSALVGVESAPSTPVAAAATSSAGPDVDAWAFWIWAAGAAVAATRLVVGLVAAARLRRSCVPAREARVLAAAASAAAGAGLPALRVRVGDAVASPVTVGVRRPVVLLPTAFAEQAEDVDLDAALLHEASHVRGRDPLAGLVARAAGVLHWFDPLARFAARALLDAQERVADAAVLSSRRVAPARYAQCLVRVAERAAGGRAPALAAGMSSRGAALEARVEALFAPGAAEPPALRARGRAVATALAAAAMAALLVAHEGAASADGEPAGAAGGANGLTYVGRVVDAAGAPVAGETVYVIHGPAPQVMENSALLPWRDLPDHLPAQPVGGSAIERAEGATSEDGRFRVVGVEPPAGGWFVVVHPGYAPARVGVDARGVSDRRLDAGDLRLARGGGVRVRVTTADGTPAAGAYVVAQPTGMPYERYAPGEIRATRTADDGTAEVLGLRDAEYAVAAFTDSAPPVEQRFVAKAGTTRDVGLRLQAGATLKVVVLDRGSGAPLPGARVDLERRPPQDQRTFEIGVPPLATARTDASGVATFAGLEKAEYVTTAVPPDRASDGIHSPPPFSVATTATPPADVTLRLDAPVTFPIAAVDAETGAPVRALLVQAYADWKTYDRSGGTPVDVRVTFDAPQPAFAVAGLREGPWKFSLLAPDHFPATTEVVEVRRGAAPLRVALKPAQRTTIGRLVAGDGTPVAGASVSSYEWVQDLGEGQRTAATTDAQGFFRLSPLLGTGWPLRVEVHAKGFMTLVTGQEADRRMWNLGDVSLERGGTVTGVVRDGDGRPFQSVEVSMFPSDVAGHGKGDGTFATTDDQGRFTMEPSRAGSYRLFAPGSGRLDVRVREGERTEVTLTARR